MIGSDRIGSVTGRTALAAAFADRTCRSSGRPRASQSDPGSKFMIIRWHRIGFSPAPNHSCVPAPDLIILGNKLGNAAGQTDPPTVCPSDGAGPPGTPARSHRVLAPGPAAQPVQCGTEAAVTAAAG
eukprot:12243-Hanusia_phi.AAC.2